MSYRICLSPFKKNEMVMRLKFYVEVSVKFALGYIHHFRRDFFDPNQRTLLPKSIGKDFMLVEDVVVKTLRHSIPLSILSIVHSKACCRERVRCMVYGVRCTVWCTGMIKQAGTPNVSILKNHEFPTRKEPLLAFCFPVNNTTAHFESL